MKLLQTEKRREPHPKNPNNVRINLKLHGSESDGPEAAGNSLRFSPPSQKKTRDLPNLTECHGCGVKVDFCTGKNRLHTLYSEWRIVLLCRKCFSSVESSEICSYCFLEKSAECFRCAQCQHSVHKKCFSKYKDAAPWSYACLGSEFSVCVDCWIPKSMAVSRRRIKNRKVRKKGSVILEKGTSRVLDGGNSAESLEDVVKDANRVVEEKVEAAARAREEAAKKAVVARRAVEVATSALSLIANRGDNSLNEHIKMDTDKVVDDSELAFDLYPQMKRSPRISKSCCLLNSSYLDIPKLWVSSIDSSCKRSHPSNASDFLKHEVSNDNKIHEDSHKNSFEPSFCISVLDHNSSTDLIRPNMDRSDMRTGSKDGDCIADCDAEEDIGEDLMKEGEGSCSNRLINFSGEDSSMDLDHKQADSALHGEERCNGQPGRYFLKYSRRACRLKRMSDCKPKILYDDIYPESQGSAAEVPLNCSWELRTLSNASFQSFHAPLQASACESEYFREPS